MKISYRVLLIRIFKTTMIVEVSKVAKIRLISDILNNLDSKLNHLNLEMRDQLAQIIVDYKHLFLDVPSK